MGPAEWGMLIALSIVWGGSFYFFAVAASELPTFTIVLLRVGLGAAALWIVVLAMGLRLPRQPAVWRSFLVMGLLNNAIPFSLIAWGQRAIAPGLASILNATTPFFTVLLANALTEDERLSWHRLAGAILGLAGVAMMMGLDAVAGLGNTVWAQLAIVTAAIAYAGASVFGRRFASVPPLITAAGQTSASSLLLLPLVLAVDMPWRLPLPGTEVVLAILGLAFLCTALAYVVYFTILRRAGATNIMMVTFLMPVSAIALGAMFLKERLGPQHLLGMIAIGLGLALIDGRLLRRLSRL